MPPGAMDREWKLISARDRPKLRADYQQGPVGHSFQLATAGDRRTATTGGA